MKKIYGILCVTLVVGGSEINAFAPGRPSNTAMGNAMKQGVAAATSRSVSGTNNDQKKQKNGLHEVEKKLDKALHSDNKKEYLSLLRGYSNEFSHGKLTQLFDDACAKWGHEYSSYDDRTIENIFDFFIEHGAKPSQITFMHLVIDQEVELITLLLDNDPSLLGNYDQAEILRIAKGLKDKGMYNLLATY